MEHTGNIFLHYTKPETEHTKLAPNLSGKLPPSEYGRGAMTKKIFTISHTSKLSSCFSCVGTILFLHRQQPVPKPLDVILCGLLLLLLLALW